MYLNVGEVSRVLKIPKENIRYYVRQNLLSPHKNQENDYWEYSTEDVLILTDILFYRDMGLSLKEIKKIIGGAHLDDFPTIIHERRTNLEHELRTLQEKLDHLKKWNQYFEEELSLLGKYTILPMPPELRSSNDLIEGEHLLEHLDKGLHIKRRDWAYVSVSFFVDTRKEPWMIKNYLSINKRTESAKDNIGDHICEEKADVCLATQVHFEGDFQSALKPLLDYAKEHGYQLTGEIYGRENTNYYVDGRRHALYRIYAPLLSE